MGVFIFVFCLLIINLINCFKKYECNHLILVDHADLKIIWFGKYNKKKKSVAKQINVL